MNLEALLRPIWPFMIDNTTNLDVILAELYSRAILSREGIEIIETPFTNATKRERHDSLYTTLVRKNLNPEILIDIFLSTNNQHLVHRILQRPPESYYEVPTVPAAVKYLDSKLHKIYENEITILRRLNSPNIIRYFSTYVYSFENSAKAFYIAMELAEMNLEDYVQNEKNLPDNDGSETGKFLVEACQGLVTLHNNNIIHRDIKPQNILITHAEGSSSGQRIAKLSDFGISKNLAALTTQSTAGNHGTLDWASPEMLVAIQKTENLVCTKSTDIFSLGLTIFYSVTKCHPAGNPVFRLTNILAGNFNFNLLKDDQFNHTIVIKKMLTMDPGGRPLMENVLKYPWFWSNDEILRFIEKVANFLSKDASKVKDRQDLEKLSSNIFGPGGTWKNVLCENVIRFLEDPSYRKKYDLKSVIKLLEFIRDKSQHCQEWPEYVKTDKVFGQPGVHGTGPTYISYFTTRFPKLVPTLYLQMEKFNL